VRQVALRSLATFKHGGTPSKANPAYWHGDIPWVSPKDMKQSAIGDASDHISQDAVDGSATSVVPVGSILIVVRSGILVHSLPVAQVTKPLAFNQDIKAVLPASDEADADYLYWFLRSQARDVLSRGVKKGATVHSVQSGFIESLVVPLPPLPEQRRIVDLLTRAEGIVRLRREAAAKAAELIPALFIHHFGEPASNPMDWPVRDLAEITGEFRYGTSQKSGPNGLPVLRIPNVIGGGLDLGEIKLVTLKQTEMERLRLRDNDLLFVRTNGNPDFVGRSAVYRRAALDAIGMAGDNCVYASYLIRARLQQVPVSAYFVQAYLSTDHGRKLLRERAKTSAGQYNINIEGLGSLPIQCPPTELQDRFREKADAVSAILAQQTTALAKAQATFDAMLAQAFSTSTNPAIPQE
jgi:type I restriction enzyme, S subunit